MPTNNPLRVMTDEEFRSSYGKGLEVLDVITCDWDNLAYGDAGDFNSRLRALAPSNATHYDFMTDGVDDDPLLTYDRGNPGFVRRSCRVNFYRLAA